MTQKQLLPHGPYQAKLIARRTVPPTGNPNVRNAVCVELTAEITAGPYARQKLPFKVWGASRIDRARALREGELLKIHVSHRTLDDGRVVNNVVDFEPFGALVAADTAGDDSGEHQAPGGCDSSGGHAGPVLPPDELLELLKAAAQGQAAGQASADRQASDVLAGTLAAGRDEYAQEFHLGFWSNRKQGTRSIANHDEIVRGFAAADPALVSQGEGYVSVFQYTAELPAYREASPEKSLAGYRGRSWAAWLAIDIDGDGTPEDLDRTFRDACLLVEVLVNLGVPRESVPVFFSGNRGVHVLFPSAGFAAGPRNDFEKAAGAVCRTIAAVTGVGIDNSIYTSLKSLRAANTRHDTTGLYKILITHDELPGMTGSVARQLASQPRPFEMPDWRVPPVDLLVDLWRWACQPVVSPSSPGTNAVNTGERRVFRDTLDLIGHGAPEGTRSTRFFRAAMNLRDFNCPEELIFALLEPAARISNYPPHELHSQIRGAIKAHAAANNAAIFS